MTVVPRIACPKCKAVLKLAASAAPKKVRCRKCGATLRLVSKKQAPANAAAKPAPATKIGVPEKKAAPAKKQTLKGQAPPQPKRTQARPAPAPAPPPNPSPMRSSSKPAPSASAGDDGEGINLFWPLVILGVAALVLIGWWSLGRWGRTDPPRPKVDPKLLQQRIPKPGQ